jgi:hypothetical protein
MVNHDRFQQGILLAILINTLSMGIEYHNQVSSTLCRIVLIIDKNNVAVKLIFALYSPKR